MIYPVMILFSIRKVNGKETYFEKDGEMYMKA